MIEASLTGVVRTILILIGLIVVLRFLGQLMQAKRNMEKERELNRKHRESAEEAIRTRKQFGRTQVIDSNVNGQAIEDVDFEEIN